MSHVIRREVHRLPMELRIRRLLRGITLAELSERAGIPVSTINNWEVGHYEPSLERLELWAGSLGLGVVLLGKEEADAAGTGTYTEAGQVRLLREGGGAQGPRPPGLLLG